MDRKDLQSLPDALAADFAEYNQRTGLNATKTLTSLLGTPRSTIYQWAEGRLELPPLRIMQVIIRELGATNLLRALAHNCGGWFIPYPASGAAKDADILPVLRESTEAVEAWLTGHADGEWTEAECEEFERQAREAQQALEAAICKARHELAMGKEQRKSHLRVM